MHDLIQISGFCKQVSLFGDFDLDEMKNCCIQETVNFYGLLVWSVINNKHLGSHVYRLAIFFLIHVLYKHIMCWAWVFIWCELIFMWCEWIFMWMSFRRRFKIEISKNRMTWSNGRAIIVCIINIRRLMPIRTMQPGAFFSLTSGGYWYENILKWKKKENN